MCLPGLHITLGVFLRLFTLLEDECHKLDLEIASGTNVQSGDRPSFVDYSLAVQMERALLDEQTAEEKQVKWLHQTISRSSDPSTDPQIASVAKYLDERKNRISDIVSAYNVCLLHFHPLPPSKAKELVGIKKHLSKDLTRKDGPFVRSLDDALASFNVHRQAYYSGSFVGNHIHRALKVEKPQL